MGWNTAQFFAVAGAARPQPAQQWLVDDDGWSQDPGSHRPSGKSLLKKWFKAKNKQRVSIIVTTRVGIIARGDILTDGGLPHVF